VAGAIDGHGGDLDADADLDLDAEAGVEADLEASGAPGWAANIAAFFNIGSVPLMVFITLLTLSMWALAMIANLYLIPDPAGWAALVLFPVVLVVSLFVARLLSTPFKGMYRQMNEGGISKRQLAGKTCVITVAVAPGRIGQAELTFEGHHFLLNVRTADDESLARDTAALLVEYEPDTDCFVVTQFDV
jgi:membrane protein implicated in regulation of membrane protease activity